MPILHGLTLVLLLTGGLPGRTGAAAPPAQETDAVFHEMTEVVVVNVDVTVTDRLGRPILGLGPEDFTVLENGRPVGITNFAAVDQRGSTGPDAPAASAAAAEGPVPEQSEPASEDGLDLFVYVDNFNLLAQRRDQVLDTLVESLRRTLRPVDRVTVVVHDGGHLAFLLRRSSSLPEIVRAIGSIRQMPAAGLDKSLLERRALGDINTVFELYADQDPCNDGRDALLSIAENHANQLSHHLEASLRGLETLVRVLGAVEGRKAVLHVSDGLPAQPGLGLFALLEDRCRTGEFLPRARSFDESKGLAALTASANDNRVTFFPLQASGVVEPIDFPTSTRQAMRQNLQYPLEVMARDTGGRAILNTHDFQGPLRTLDSDFRVYYSIGYRPPDVTTADGENREIEVRLARELPGAQLRYRRRYQPRSVEERLVGRTLGALYGFESDRLGISLAIGKAPGAKASKAVLTIGLPRERLTYIPRNGHWECAIELAIGQVGEDGERTRQRRITLTAEGADTGPPGGVETIRVAVDAEPGSNRFAVSVADLASSRIGTAAGTVEVPAAGS